MIRIGVCILWEYEAKARRRLKRFLIAYSVIVG